MTAEPGDEVSAIRDRIDLERDELSQTVEALAYKVDVKARAHDKVVGLKTAAQDKVHEVTGAVTDKAHEVAGAVQDKAAEVAGAVQGKAHEVAVVAQEKAHEVAVAVRRPTIAWPLAATVAALGAVVVIFRRLSGGR